MRRLGTNGSTVHTVHIFNAMDPKIMQRQDPKPPKIKGWDFDQW